jgi:hypothetical protein
MPARGNSQTRPHGIPIKPLIGCAFNSDFGLLFKVKNQLEKRE